MPSPTTALLFALTSPRPSLPLAEFNQWYDERHAPSRAACPGVNNVCRFQLVDDATENKRVGDWTWLAVYELETEDVLKSEEYKRAREADGDDESRMFEFLSRRVYTLVEDKKSEDYEKYLQNGKSRIMSMVGLLASKGNGREVLEQYKRSTKGVAADHGWLRTSSWSLATAADPRTWEEQSDVPSLLVLQEWEDTGLLRGLQDSARGTRNEIGEKALLKLWKQF